MKFLKALGNFDMYAKPIEFKFVSDEKSDGDSGDDSSDSSEDDSKKYDDVEKITTWIGTFTSILVASIIIVYGVKEFSIMAALGNTEFITYEFNQNSTAIPLRLADYNSSANFIFGIVDKQFDFFDNPYIRVNAYELTESYKLSESRTHKLRLCNKQDLL